MDPIQKKKNMLSKKIEASLNETDMFEDYVQEIEDLLQTNMENTLSELEEKQDLMIEMLKNRTESLANQTKAHYKKQELFLMEAKKNVERRKTNLQKINGKIAGIEEAKHANRLERLNDEFLNINRTFNSPFHQFKDCKVNLNPQIANQMFEQIGSLKYPDVQYSNKNTFKFYNQKYKPITKAFFFGDSNN